MNRKIPTFVNVLTISDYSDNQSQAQSEANTHFLRGVYNYKSDQVRLYIKSKQSHYRKVR
jgi:hypothetical protein